MNWLTKTFISSGFQKSAKPIQITDQMDYLAERCVDIIMSMTGMDSYGAPALASLVLASKIDVNGISVPIEVVIYPSERSKKGELASAQTPTWWKQSNPNSEEGWTPEYCLISVFDTPPVPRNHRFDLKKAILHELVHSIDPKLNKSNIFKSKWHSKHRQHMNNPGYQNSPEYFDAPWEQDAYMSSEAFDQVKMWKRNDVSRERAQEVLRYFLPSSVAENHYAKDPKMWNRYMRSMYESFNKIYGKANDELAN
jgi:hypothetical protein